MFLLITIGVILLLIIISEPPKKRFEDKEKSSLEIELKM
jgi:hypothetical protein